MLSRKSATYAIITLFAINILNFYDRNVAGALVEPMRKEFHLSDTQVGLLGSAFIWLYAVIGVPLGKIADVWSRKKLLALGVTVWSTLTAFTYFASSYPMLMFARLGVASGRPRARPQPQVGWAIWCRPRSVRGPWRCSCWVCRLAAR